MNFIEQNIVHLPFSAVAIPICDSSAGMKIRTFQSEIVRKFNE